MLERIQNPNDIKKLKWEELEVLAMEIREFLVDKVSKTGGHLASNLGVVELTMAMHLAFSLPKDKMIWDVGHQAYTHKLLTGRKEEFDSLRQFGGMSGFPKRGESPCDVFETGHSTTSISAGLGFVEARELTGENYRVVSVIGDGSLTGGMAYEALNNAARLKSNYIIVLNDNNMSISENVGGMSAYLDSIRTAEFYNELKKGVVNSLSKIPVIGEGTVRNIRKTKNSIKRFLVPGMFFEDIGITYLGPVDGHDLKMLYRTFKEAQRMDNAVLIHVLTKKGKGYAPAEQNPSKFHGIGPFDKETGEVLGKSSKMSYTDAFSEIICDLGAKEEKLTAITAAMKDGTGLVKFQEKYPDRFFDVGIAEEHAVTFAAGLAAAGMKPVFAVYSAFLQRSYDQIVHDVCMMNLPVIFAVDRAGLVGNDGETHQGVYDMAFMNHIPNMTLISPKNRQEFADMMAFAVNHKGPVAIRYPRGAVYEGLEDFRAPIELGKSELIYKGTDIAVIGVGHMMEVAEEVHQLLVDKQISSTLVNARFVKPLDKKMLEDLAKEHKLIVTIEDGVVSGGFGASVRECLAEIDSKVKVMINGIPDQFIEHGSISQLRKVIGLDAESIVKKIEEFRR